MGRKPRKRESVCEGVEDLRRTNGWPEEDLGGMWCSRFLVHLVVLISSQPLYGEAVVWKRLRHPNVVPFLGVATASLQLVSKWMPNGTLTEYVSTQPHVDRISLVSVPLRRILGKTDFLQALGCCGRSQLSPHLSYCAWRFEGCEYCIC